MFRTLSILAITLALASCADPKYVQKDTGPTAKLVLVQTGKTSALTFDNETAKRALLLRINEPTKSINVPAGEPFVVQFGWDGAFVGCIPIIKFTPIAGYSYTLQPGDKRKCELTLVDQDGNSVVAPTNSSP